MFSVLADKSDERTKEIIMGANAAGGPEAKKVADYFSSFMDEAAIEAKGITPIQPELDAIAKIKDQKGLIAAFAHNSRMFRGSPIGTVVGQDDKNPETHIANISQGGLGLPDQATCTTPRTSSSRPMREGYKKYLETMLELVGCQERGEARGRRLRRSRRRSPRCTGPGSRTAIRRRPTTS